MSSGYIDRILKLNQSYSKFLPRKIAKDVSFKVIVWYEENSSKLPGVDYVMETQRDYSFGINGSHMFGYTKEIPLEIFQKRKNEYDIGDEIGFGGIEKLTKIIYAAIRELNTCLLTRSRKQLEDMKAVKRIRHY